ncbi:MAG: hypothetical protein J6M41_04860 [Prevotella sp.]|nr:hypothetical protein [Prevotella sp.]
MRKISFFLILCACLAVLTSCSKKKKLTLEQVDSELRNGPLMDMNHNDTTAVYDLTNQFLAYLKDSNLDAAMGMLHYLKDGEEIVSLPAELEKRNRMVLGNFLGLTYNIDEARFLTETDCQVRYTVTLFEKAADDPVSNKISFFLKPVRREGQWYLTMADTQTDSTHGSRITN